MNIDAEEVAFQSEVAAVKEWWKNPRWRQIKRPFSAEQIVSKRGNLNVQYPSNVQAKKLWKILEERFEVGVLIPLRHSCGQVMLTSSFRINP